MRTAHLHRLVAVATPDHRFARIQVWLDGRRLLSVRSGTASPTVWIARPGRHTVAISRYGSRHVFLHTTRTLTAGGSYTAAVTGPAEAYACAPSCPAHVADRLTWLVDRPTTAPGEARVRLVDLVAGAAPLSVGYDPASPAAPGVGAPLTPVVTDLPFGHASGYVGLPTRPVDGYGDLSAYELAVDAAGHGGRIDLVLRPQQVLTVFVYRYVTPERAAGGVLSIVVGG